MGCHRVLYVLGPLLFINYINDLDSGISSEVSKFMDNTKGGRVIRTDQDASELHCDLNRLYEWARKWQMEFNIGKCNTPEPRYMMHRYTIFRFYEVPLFRNMSRYPFGMIYVYDRSHSRSSVFSTNTTTTQNN